MLAIVVLPSIAATFYWSLWPWTHLHNLTTVHYARETPLAAIGMALASRIDAPGDSRAAASVLLVRAQAFRVPQDAHL